MIVDAEDGVTFGEFASAPETNVYWDDWKYEGSAVAVVKTSPWGRIELQDGEAAVSPVIDLTNTDSKYLSIGLNAYLDGYGTYAIYWRGSTSAPWNQGASSPAWEAYSPGNKTWRWVQIKIVSV